MSFPRWWDWLEAGSGSSARRRAAKALEGLVGASWRVFRFTSPETSLSSGLLLFPSLSEGDRFGGNLNLSLRREIVENFFLDLSTYYEYDSRPPSDESVSTEDYGVVPSVGYSF